MDDHPDVFKAQKKNCIFMYPFKLENKDSTEDDFLLKLIPKLKTTIKYFKQSGEINTSNINKEM